MKTTNKSENGKIVAEISCILELVRQEEEYYSEFFPKRSPANRPDYPPVESIPNESSVD